jgi:5'/3'-nucleotidase SurE
MNTSPIPHVLLNINLPGLPLAKIRRAEITKLASRSHIDAVEEGHNGIHEYYWLVRQRLISNAPPETDIGAIERGNISVTPLEHYYTNRKTPSQVLKNLCSTLLDEIKS